MIVDIHSLGKATPLVLTAGARGRWTLAVVVNGVRHEFVGKNISVVGWEYVIETHEDGAAAGGPLSEHQRAL